MHYSDVTAHFTFITPPFHTLPCHSLLYQRLQRGHNAEGDRRDDTLELAHLSEKAEEAEGPQDPELLDPAVGPAAESLILSRAGIKKKTKEPEGLGQYEDEKETSKSTRNRGGSELEGGGLEDNTQNSKQFNACQLLRQPSCI